MAMNIDHWWDAAARKAVIEQREEVTKAQLLARCIADEFERRGLVVQPSEPGRLDNPEAPMWEQYDALMRERHDPH